MKCHPERSEGSHKFLRYAQDKLRFTPQNDITTHPPLGGGREDTKSAAEYPLLVTLAVRSLLSLDT
jgi:hypothetical protein